MFKSFVVPSSEVPGYSPIYRHPDYKDGTLNGKFADLTTLYEVFKAQVKNYPKEKFLGSRIFYPETNTFGGYEWLTTTDVDEMIGDYGSGLDQIFAKHAPDMNETTGQQPLGIFSINRPEWVLTELTAFRSRRYSVGISDFTGVESSEFFISHSELKVIVCSMDKIPRMLERIEHTPKLKVIISMDKLDCSKPTPFTQAFNAEITEELRFKAASLNIVMLDIDQVIEIGRAKPIEPTPPKPSDYCTLCFSSGTTSAQKGVLISHDAFVSASRSVHLILQSNDTTYLSFMSMSHIFERCLIYSFMHDIAHIGFFGGDKVHLFSDMQALRPNTVAAIPLVLNTIYDKAAASTIGAKGIVGLLSRAGYKSKIKRIGSGRGFKHALWDKLIFSKVAQLFGGNVRLLISGAMPLTPDVHNFFRVALSCNVIQGYGQTETVASGTVQRPDEVSVGNVGTPSPGVDIRLRSIPEMGYDATSPLCPRGEMMVRGKSIFSEYYKAPEKTAEVLDCEWLATGDIVQCNADGTLSIIDRIKHVIRSPSTMYLEPEPIEQLYKKHHLVDSVFFGSSLLPRGGQSSAEQSAEPKQEPNYEVHSVPQLSQNSAISTESYRYDI
ncbi:medium-chain fatty acid-CoA ligase faa2 [Coemansia erecta]|uniref:Medium-chain fatty acid-CoA ligase faa2 n=1 Tax=Coemansia erecta TaxID=147472 RepID=A0A9W8CTI8_9FUNG|nr:medium-chain fatty acid-CoA ligase faa2 [Coemansia erecta]